ncbi:hypothetical protein JCM10207_000307 [Rhodosporidiobolus poonsookiae]
MAKGSGRFRNRKLGFKTRINVEIGVVIEDDPLDADLDIEDDKGRKGPETGVDKDEEGEVHLQAVIASTAAQVSRGGSHGKKPAQAYIPTRGTTEIPDAEFRALYRSGYVDPFSYIRFSDTVEDCRKGADYTMDDDDEDWLEEFNAQIAARTAAPAANGDDDASGRRTKGKAAADGPSSGLTAPLSEDDFEWIMEVFETVTDQKAPMAHVNTNLLPPLDDFDDAFHDVLKPHLAKLRPYATDVFPHWRERRVARGGKPVIPQLDYDESNENNPYVCFRRREPKTSRKTRRSDQQNLERLIRLRNDLYAAHALMVKVHERERLKLDGIEVEKRVFEERCAMRELKRRLNEPDGDEELLISRREKKRKRDDPLNASLRLQLRKPDASGLSPAALVPPLEELQARKQRNDAIFKQIERDLQRKKQGDQHWDDWTDSSYLARPPATPARFWRTIEPVPHAIPFNGLPGKRELGFAASYQPPLGRVRPSFRKRVGRGGRVLIDRISVAAREDGALPPRKRRSPALVRDADASDADEDEEEDEWLATRRAERHKYDTDAGLDFPTADEPVLIDDFELPYLYRRLGLLKPSDLESLSLDTSYLDEVFRFVSQDPDKNQPAPTVIGRPPPRPALQMAPSQAVAAAGSPLPQPGAQPNAAAYAAAQQQLAAQQAIRIAQQQAALRQKAAAAVAAGGQDGQMRRTPSQQGSPVAAGQSPMPQLPLALPNGASLPPGSSPAAQYHPGAAYNPHGSPVNLGANGLPLPPASQQPPQRPNGLAASPQPSAHLQQQLQQINGANGLPATSRLSAPPYSSNPALAMALQAQANQQALAAAAAAAGRPMSANGVAMPHPPSRPASAASMNGHSPHLGGAAPLPNMSPRSSAAGIPGVVGVNGMGTPPPGAMGVKRGSPMQPLQLGPGGFANLPPGMQAAAMAQQLAQKQAQAQAQAQGAFGAF